MHHPSAITTSRRRIALAGRCVGLRSAGRLFRPSHAGRYFGGLWFKVFSERGPC